MDAPINEIIKNIIHIDKSAVQLREKLNNEIGDRRIQTNNEIEKLRENIVEEEIKKIAELEKEEIHRAEIEAESIKHSAIEKTNEMYNSFLSSKEDLIKEMFKKIIST
ncbi:MAG: hypothetical protein K0R09_1797 [Clostridiales bacterium]|jgi:hypothetical protein|nr:hypothetical protein [Clostridiales bacterium]